MRSDRSTKVAVAVLSALYVFSIFIIGWSWYSSHQEACASRGKILDVIERTLQRSQPSLQEIEQMPPDQRDRVMKFYTSTYQDIQEARC
jgi:hypothetical protein